MFLIGPLAHTSILNKFGKIEGWVIDWSKPGAVERFEAEEKEWWDNYKPWKDEF